MQVPLPEQDPEPVCILQLPAFQGQWENPFISLFDIHTEQKGTWHLDRAILWNNAKKQMNSQLLSPSLIRLWHCRYPCTTEPSPPSLPPTNGVVLREGSLEEEAQQSGCLGLPAVHEAW